MSNNQSVGKKLFSYNTVLLIYPFLLAYYPIFALRNHNISYVDFSSILRSLILVTAGTVVIYAVTFFFIRNKEKSSIITSSIVILFLSYGQIYNQLENSAVIPIRHRYLLGASSLVFMLVVVLVLKKAQVVRSVPPIPGHS